jgi:4-amino-4-deoxy-L-arabinose transferase-like glycosyltransferase
MTFAEPGLAMTKRLNDFARWFGENRQVVPVLFTLFLALRAAAILLDVTPSSDAAWYFSRAAMLAQGRGYLGDHGQATAYWPPGWPLALSAVFRAFGASVVAVGLFNLACSALTAWLTLDLGRKLFGSQLAGRTALALLAVYPNSILYVPLALTEVFYTTLLLASCWLLIARTDWLALIAAGFVFGMATLVKAQTLVVVPMVFAIGLWRAPQFWRRLPAALGRAAVLVAVAALVVAPWTIRNHRELGAWVAVSTNGGITLLTGNNDSAKGGFTPEDAVVKALDARTGLSELAYDAQAKQLGINWIREHPRRFVTLMPIKLVRLWVPDGEGQWAYETGSPSYAAAPLAFLALRAANQAWYALLMAGFLCAGYAQVRRRVADGRRVIDWWVLPFGIALYPSMIAMVFSGQSRFHYPAMPFVAMAAGWLLADWLLRATTVQGSAPKAPGNAELNAFDA